MKTLIFTIAVLTLSSAAQAAPQLKCRATDQNEVIEALGLSQDGKHIDLISPRAMIVQKLAIKDVKVQGPNTVISGPVVSINDGIPSGPQLCAGSCPSESFELKMFAGEIAPNSTLTFVTSGFSETEGRHMTTKREKKYSCSFSGFEAAGATQLKPGAFSMFGSLNPNMSCSTGTRLVLDKGQVMGEVALLEDFVQGFCEMFVAPNPRYIKLQSIEIGDCGATVMKGGVVEGSEYYSVEIVDNRSLTCRIKPEAQVVMTYKTRGSEKKFYSNSRSSIR